jgi:gluconolactonase
MDSPAPAADHLTVADPAIHRIVPASSKVEQIATGFGFTEGPVWMPDGSLLFSDIPNNSILRWTPGGKASVFRKPSGYDKNDAPEGAFIGSNGLTLDGQGRLTICEHGNGRVTRLEKDGKLTVLADKFEGKRLNSPNDAVYHSNGALYFTDPPYGFVKQDEDPKKELSFNGVFRFHNGVLRLLYKELTRPNGLAFSPDEKILYVANSDRARKIWMRFTVGSDGGLSGGTVFYDTTEHTAPGVPDGMKIDREGNVYGTGPGGIWIIAPSGKHLGTLHFPEVPANLHWGEADGQTLYVTARTSVYRIKLGIPGIRPRI